MKSVKLNMTLLVISSFVLALAAPSFAQSKKVEINPFFGYTLSEGVDVDPFIADGQTYNAINPTSGLSYGVQFGVFVTENIEVGFLWSRQDSTLEAKGLTSTDFTDMTNSNYHGIFTYNWGDEDAPARPFLFGGLGATVFSPADVGGLSVSSASKFSSTWGGGIKAYMSENVGFTGMMRWTPTYIKSDPGGIWCSPYWFWGCYYVGDPDYANQFELSAGLSLRF